MSTHFICSQCRMILSESERRSHISAEHLDYFPFGCPFCKKANKKHLETTKEDMDEHIATYHNGNNLGILLLEDRAKEVELTRMIEQCQDFRQLNGAGTSAGSGNTAQNASDSAQVKDEIESGDDVIIIDDDTETAGMPNNPSGGNLPEQPTQEPDERIAKMEIDEAIEHSSANPILNSDALLLLNAVMTKSEHSFSQENDHSERPTTSSQVTSSVPADSSQKQIITKLFIVISEGIVCYETSDSHTYDYAPLSEYLPILQESELCKNGCEVVIQFYEGDTITPFNYRYSGNKYKNIFTLEHLKLVARQLHSIAFLWADVTVIAHFGSFIKMRSGTFYQLALDYCCALFSRERSILKCKKLDIVLFDNWPLSIVTNVVDRCEACDLRLEEIIPGNCEVHESFLKELYETEMLHKVAVSLCIPCDEAVNDFIAKLIERFRGAPEKCFQFELFTHSKEVRKLSFKTQGCILKSKTMSQESVIIEQRAIGS